MNNTNIRVSIIELTDCSEMGGVNLITDIYSFVRNVYMERAKEDICFPMLQTSLNDYITEIRNSKNVFFCASDEKHQIVGVARLILKEPAYGYLCNFAVLPAIQGRHIGTLLLNSVKQFAERRSLNHIQSSTAAKAQSSVRCHERNGYCRIALRPNKGYWSYAFRLQLKYHWLWSTSQFCRIRFLLSYCKQHFSASIKNK